VPLAGALVCSRQTVDLLSGDYPGLHIRLEARAARSV